MKYQIDYGINNYIQDLILMRLKKENQEKSQNNISFDIITDTTTFMGLGQYPIN